MTVSDLSGNGGQQSGEHFASPLVHILTQQAADPRNRRTTVRGNIISDRRRPTSCVDTILLTLKHPRKHNCYNRKSIRLKGRHEVMVCRRIAQWCCSVCMCRQRLGGTVTGQYRGSIRAQFEIG